MKLERRLGLKDDERLLAVVRAASVTLLLPGLLVAGLLLAPFFFMMPLVRWETLGFIIMGLSAGLGAFLGLRWLVIWRGSVCAVTERRIIIVQRKGFFDRRVTELPFSKIHEVSYVVKGMLATIFRYGTVLIESAGSDEPIAVKKVSHPGRLQDLITELQGETAGGAGDFGEVLQAVSRMDGRKLALLKAEIERTERFMPPESRGQGGTE